MESFLGDLVKHGRRDDELSSEGPVKLGVVWAIVGTGDLFYIPSGIFVCQRESVADVGSCWLGTFSFDERGN